MQQHITEIIEVLRPVLKSIRRAELRLESYWADRIALIWSTEDVHRAANENETVLNELQARELLHDLHQHHNAQYGLRWEDLAESIEQSGLGRDMRKRELHRFVHHNVLAIDPVKKGSSK